MFKASMRALIVQGLSMENQVLVWSLCWLMFQPKVPWWEAVSHWVQMTWKNKSSCNWSARDGDPDSLQTQ